MKKYIAVPVGLLVLWVAFLVSAFNSKPVPVPGPVLNQYEKAQLQTVLVRSPDGSGSGVVVQRANSLGEPRLFVWTAAHVVEGYNQVEVVRTARQDGAKLDCELVWAALVIARDAHIDVAVLWLDTKPSEFFLPVEFDFVIPHVGDSVFHVGNFYGADFDGSVSTGVISQLGVTPSDRYRNWFWANLDQTTAFAVPGSSGGPVFDAQGEVIGLIVSGPIRTGGISCYVPTRIMEKWAMSEGFGWSLRGPWCPQDVILKSLNEFMNLAHTMEVH